MPKYRVTAPNGKTYEINAPDGATQEEVLAYAKANFEAAAPDAAAADAPEMPAADEPQTLGELTAGAASQLGEDILAAGRGLPEGFRRAATGIAQLGAMAIPETLGGSRIEQGVNQYSAEAQRQFAESPVGQTYAGRVGAGAGEVLATLPLGYLGVAPKGAGVIRQMIQGAAAGYGMGLATEGTAEQKMAAANVGAAGGALLPPVIIGGQNAVGWARKKLLPTQGMAQREAAELIEGAAQNLPAVKQSLTRIAPEYVPDSLPSAAEYTGDVGLLALQNTAKAKINRFRDFLNVRETLNNDAREAYIRDVFEGADEATYKAIKAARDSQGAIDRLGLMNVTGINVKPVTRYIAGQLAAHENRETMENIVRPIVGKLFQREIPEAVRKANAASMVREFVQTRGAQLDPAVKRSLLEMADGRPVGLGAIRASQDPGVQSLMRGYKAVLSRETKDIDDFHRLYNARKQLNDWVDMKGGTDTDAQRFRIAGAELIAIRNRLDEQINKVAPEFAQYLSSFAGASRRMEQNRAGQELLGAAGAGQPLGQRAANLANNPDKLAQMAANNEAATAAGTFTPQQQQALLNLRQDIVRQRSPMGKGSFAMPEEGVGVGNAYTLSGPVGIAANRILNENRSKHGAQVADALAEALETPQNMAAALAKLPPAWRRKYLRATLPALGITITPKLLSEIERESAKRSNGEP